MGLNWKHRVIVAVAALLMVIATLVNAANVRCQDLAQHRQRAYDIAASSASYLDRGLQTGIYRSVSLGEWVADRDGDTGNFRMAAKLLMRDWVERIILAPGGEVSEVYPETGLPSEFTEKSKYPDEVLAYAKRYQMPVLYGPFRVNKTKKILTVVNPVFLHSGDFWGYAVIVIRVPSLYQHTLNELHSFGYDYCLDTTASPVSDRFKRIEASVGESETLDRPESKVIRIGGTRWRLSVTPSQGWYSDRVRWAFAVGLMLTVSAGMLIYSLLRVIEQERKLRTLAYQDALTGLYSRGGFMGRLEKQLEEHPETNLTAVFLDLDDFKMVNDMYGHPAGDRALITAASHLRKMFPSDSLIGRTGGDEFCVAIIGRTAAECAEMTERAVAGRISFDHGGKAITYTMSAGYADYPEQAQDRSGLMVLADEALYAVKMSGKSGARRYMPDMAEMNREQLGFSAAAMAEGVPGAFLVYRAGEDWRILFANEKLVHLTGCDSFEDLLHMTGSRFCRWIVPEDRDAFCAAMEQKTGRTGADSESSCSAIDEIREFRIITKQGTVRKVLQMADLVSDDRHGKVVFALLREREGAHPERASKAPGTQETELSYQKRRNTGCRNGEI